MPLVVGLWHEFYKRHAICPQYVNDLFDDLLCQALALLGRAHGKRSYPSSVGRSPFMSAGSAKPLDAPLAFPHADQRNVQDATYGGKNKKAGKVFPRLRNEAAR